MSKTTTLSSHKCFNCKEPAKYHLDDSFGQNCSQCSEDSLCEECLLDKEYPHVVSHSNQHCSFKAIARGKTKKEAVEAWEENNNIKNARQTC